MKILKILPCSPLLIFLVFSPVFSPAMSGGGGVPGGATEFTQFLQLSVDFDKLTTAVKRVEDGIRKYQYLMNQAKGLKDGALDSMLTGKVRELLKIVQVGRETGQVLQGIEKDMMGLKEHYSGNMEFDPESILYRYAKWEESNESMINEAFESADIHYDQFKAEDEVLGELERLAQTTTGRARLQQIASLIAAEQAKQIQRLRQLFVEQLKRENMYKEIERQKQEYEDAFLDDFYGQDPDYWKRAGEKTRDIKSTLWKHTSEGR